MSEPSGIINLGADTDDDQKERHSGKKRKSYNETAFIVVTNDKRSNNEKNDFELDRDELDRELVILSVSASKRNSVISLGEDDEAEEDEEHPHVEVVPPFQGDSLFSRRMTIAGGFLDIALFTTNCEQLKSILEIGYYHQYYELVLGLLISSMVLQVAAGFTLFMVGCVTIKNPEEKKRSEIINHITMGLVALITVVNIFISSFTVKGEVIQRCMRGDLTMRKT